MVQRAARSPGAAAAAVASRHEGARGPGRPRAALPDGTHRTGDDVRRTTVEIPGEVIDILRLWRPTPLVRARRLEAALGTPARIYYKDESGSPSGSHKTNTAVAQAFYNRQDGTNRDRDRDRRGSVGECALVRVRAVRHRVQGLHGARFVRAEAVPPRAHGNVGRNRRAVARRRARSPGLARRGDQRRGPRRGRRATTRTTRSARCSTTCCCTRRSSGSRRKSSCSSRARTVPTW